MAKTPDILCIGSVLWDVIGRAPVHMRTGSDVPGRITRMPGGVAMNIAMAVVRFGLSAAVLSCIGRDPQGDALVAEADRLGIDTHFLHRSNELPTDLYMAIEGANGLVGAIADAHSLERAGARILAPMDDGRLGTATAPFAGPVALDGNLTPWLLSEIAGSPLFAAADLRVAPASPGKAARLLGLLGHPRVTLYVNLEEAQLLCRTEIANAPEAAEALVARGVRRALVTDGNRVAAEARCDADTLVARPPAVRVTRVTGAGDTFMAAHIAHEINDMDRDAALKNALRAAARHVSGEAPA